MSSTNIKNNKNNKAPSTDEVIIITNKDLYTNTFKSAQSTIGPNEVYQPDAVSKMPMTSERLQRRDFD